MTAQIVGCAGVHTLSPEEGRLKLPYGKVGKPLRLLTPACPVRSTSARGRSGNARDTEVTRLGRLQDSARWNGAESFSDEGRSIVLQAADTTVCSVSKQASGLLGAVKYLLTTRLRKQYSRWRTLATQGRTCWFPSTTALLTFTGK